MINAGTFSFSKFETWPRDQFENAARARSNYRGKHRSSRTARPQLAGEASKR
jgi:hypothetical protein